MTGVLIRRGEDAIGKAMERMRRRAQWLMPVIQHFGRTPWVDHLRSGVRDQPDQHGEIPVSTKNTTLARHVVGACNPSYLGG